MQNGGLVQVTKLTPYPQEKSLCPLGYLLHKHFPVQNSDIFIYLLTQPQEGGSYHTQHSPAIPRINRQPALGQAGLFALGLAF